VARPQTRSFEHHEATFLVYPVADEGLSADRAHPSPRLVRTLKALADERRLRVLKRLTDGSYTLQELADHFGVGSTTMFHHLVILRSAGLVRQSSGSAKRYTLRLQEVSDLSHLLEDYLRNDQA
jgi:DNA-binding transcriptional ArsR family regulator